MIFYLLLILTLFLPSGTGAQSMPTWVTSLPLNQWYQIPNTALSSVPPSPNTGFGNPNGKINAWTGAALKRQGSVYIIGMAGGHADYSGNEINALTLNTATPGWIQESPPSPNSLQYDDSQFYGDLKGGSFHSYYNAQFIDATNRFISLAGAGAQGASGAPSAPVGWAYRNNAPAGNWVYTPAYNWTTGQFEAPNYFPLLPSGTDYVATPTAKHPVTSDIYFNRANFWRRYNAATNTITVLAAAAETPFTGAAIDPIRGRILLVGDFSGTIDPRVRDLNGNNVAVTFTGLGASALRFGQGFSGSKGYYPSPIYDEVNDVFWVVYNDCDPSPTVTFNCDQTTVRTIKLYKVTPTGATTYDVTQPAVTGTAPFIKPNCTCGMPQYVPELGGLVVANSYTGNVYFMRLSATASTLGSGITTLTLTSTSTQSNAPFSVGQVFKQGDIPAGQTVRSSNVSNFQATIKSTWPDGSARFAILSGRTNLTADTPFAVNLTVGADPGGTALTESDLTATGITASVQVGATCTVNLTDLIGVAPAFSSGRWTSGRVRTWVSGPQMSSWIYYSRCGVDAHISVWFEVRLWAGGAVEVLPWVENSTLNVAAPATKAAQTITFTLGGSQRFSQSLALPHHARYPLASGSTFTHWLGTNPNVTPKHNTTYLQQTKVVPTYRASTASNSTLWSRIGQTFTPGTAVNVPFSGMGSAGYAIHIGPLPEWDVAYLTGGGDSRALASIQANAYSAGHLDIHFRDETTNQPLRFSSYPNLLVGGGEAAGFGASSTNTYTPTATGTTGGGWATSHHPSLGYMAYLLLGRFYFLEELQFTATIVYLQVTDAQRNFASAVFKTDSAPTERGAAWSMRTVAQAAVATPDGETLKTEFTNAWVNNVNYFHGRYIAASNHPQGITDQYQGGCSPNPCSAYSAQQNPYYVPAWMSDFYTFALGYGVSLQLNDVSAADQTKATAFFNWKAQWIVGRLGGTGSTEYYFADAAQFAMPAAPQFNSSWITGAGPWYANFGQIYTATRNGIPSLGLSCPQCVGATDGNLRGASAAAPTDIATGYWGNLQPAIAYAVSQGVPGALAGYNRMVGAPNWASSAAAFNNDPVWSVMPSSFPSVTPTPPTAPSNLIVRQ